MRTSNTGQRALSRRRVLAASAAGLTAAAVSGCGLFGDDPAPPAEPDALQPVLDEALALAAAYDRAQAVQPGLAVRLTPLAADHRAHAAELTKLIGVTASSGPAAAPPSAGSAAAQILAGLRRAELAAQKTAVAACGKAPAERAALVGSIAACRATHAEALT